MGHKQESDFNIELELQLEPELENNYLLCLYEISHTSKNIKFIIIHHCIVGSMLQAV